MPRRIHVNTVVPGDVPLSDREAHHARDVLRLDNGAAVEAFDDAGNVGDGTLVLAGGKAWVRVRTVRTAATNPLRIVIASAVPKAARADWLVEKLSEIGVDTFVPLVTARSVVAPEGKNKVERWARIATEAAKQSRRAGTLRISELTRLDAAIRAALDAGTAWHLSTSPDAEPIARRISELAAGGGAITLFIGPEGGWTDEETESFTRAGVSGVGLTPTVLRIETAAIAAAAFVAATLSRSPATI